VKLVLQVWHKGEYKMVAKVFPHPKDDKLILLHEESGTQAHQNLSAPGGLDKCLIPFLQEVGCQEIHHYNRKTKILFTTGLYNFLLHAKVQKSGGRERAYLPEKYWHKQYMQSALPYKVPWVSDVERFGGPLEGVQLGIPGLEGA
jgi:hypothetical protein